MKLTLPIYGNATCGYDVAVSIQLLCKSEMFVVKCTDHNQVFGDNGVFSTYGLIEFDTKDIKMQSSDVLSGESPCIDYKNIKFTPKTGEQMREWFFENYKRLNEGQ